MDFAASLWARELLVALVIGICLGVLGPFGSYLNGPLPGRLLYWVVTLLLSTCVLVFVREAAMRVPAWWRMPRCLILTVATMLAAVVLAVMSHSFALALWAGPVRHVSALAWYGETLVVCALFSLVHGFIRLPMPRVAAPVPAGDFLARLPAHLGRDLVALQMEDHYVRAHTTRGSALILVPLHQAIGELDRVPGLKVHRSWWVARDAVVSSLQDGRNVRLRLANGLVAPVARASVSAARAAGFLDADS